MVTIQLIGIGNSQYHYWKQNLQMAIKDIKEQIILEEVNDLQRIIDFGIRSIPALAFEKEVLLDQAKQAPDKEEFKRLIEKHLLKLKRNMKEIIVPIDFSENSLNAYRYAMDLSVELGATLSVIHICHPGVDSINHLSIPTMDELAAHNEKRLATFVEQSTISNGTVQLAQEVKQEVIIGFVEEEIIKISEQESTSAIVMGTRGAGGTGVFDQIFGSISSHISRNAQCPVWLVPPDAKFTGVKKIAYASNFESSDSEVFSKILDLSLLFESQLHLVHVSDDHADITLDSLALETQFKESTPFFDINVDVLQGDAVWKALDTYVEERAIDLMVLVPRKRTFWENLIHKSQTKAMIFHSKIPLLVMHVEPRPKKSPSHEK